jgi:hypothetical protein
VTAIAVHADRLAAAAYIRGEIARSTEPWPLDALAALADTIELGDHTDAQPPSTVLRVCQVATPGVDLPCPAVEGGGLRCEVSGPHDLHRIGGHTIAHALAGNGYACSAFSRD